MAMDLYEFIENAFSIPVPHLIVANPPELISETLDDPTFEIHVSFCGLDMVVVVDWDPSRNSMIVWAGASSDDYFPDFVVEPEEPETRLVEALSTEDVPEVVLGPGSLGSRDIEVLVAPEIGREGYRAWLEAYFVHALAVACTDYMLQCGHRPQEQFNQISQPPRDRLN